MTDHIRECIKPVASYYDFKFDVEYCEFYVYGVVNVSYIISLFCEYHPDIEDEVTDAISKIDVDIRIEFI